MWSKVWSSLQQRKRRLQISDFCLIFFQNPEHEQALVLLCKIDDPKVRTNAVKLFCCLTEDGDDKEIIDRIGLESIETLIYIISSSSDIEEIASAMGVISNLTQSSKLTDSLLEAERLPVI